jgi:hypothetical protein
VCQFKSMLLISHFLYLRPQSPKTPCFFTYYFTVYCLPPIVFTNTLDLVALLYVILTMSSGGDNLCYANYWKRSYIQWGIDSWDQFFFKEFPNESKQSSHSALRMELEALIKNLEPKSRKSRKALDLKCQLKVSIFNILRI